MKHLLIIVALIFSISIVKAQKLDSEELDKLSEKYTKATFQQLHELLSIPNDAFDTIAIEKNVLWCEQAFQQRNFTTTRINTDYVPLLLAERKSNKAEKTVLIYLQVDGQPVDTSRWAQENPYKPALKRQKDNGEWEEIPWDNIQNYEDDWRIFARSASDAKGPVSMFLAAIDAAKEGGIDPNYNLKVIMDFEEEMGSPHLPDAVARNVELLKSDMLVIFDGPRHITNQPTLSFGARGIATVTLTTYGPVAPQHSGHYGNYVPNPALGLSQVLGSMKDENGRVVIPGYYDGVSIDKETEEILRAVPDDEKGIRDRLQIGTVDNVGSSYQESIQYPSLNIRGIQSGWINEKVRTIIPSWARAEIDVRLVLESKPERLLGLIRTHIEGQGYFVLDRAPTKEERMSNKKIATFTSEISYQSFRTDFNSDVGIWLKRALKTAFEKDPIMIRMSGGSIPISPFVLTLGIPAVAVPTVNRDNNQHSPNENLRLGNYREGIKTMIAILAEKL